MISLPKTIPLLACLHIASPVEADGVKVLSVSPDKRIEIITKVDDFLPTFEKLRPHAKKSLVGAGIFARFVGSDSPPTVLWAEGYSSIQAYVEWDPSSTRLYITHGDEKAWASKLFVLRKDVRTGRLLFVEPRLPELTSLLSLNAEIPLKDKRSPWRQAIFDWQDREKVILSLHLEDDYGRIMAK